MTRARLPISLIALSSLSLSACASLGTNISSSFDCKAPGGSCAPTSQIDAAASAAMIDSTHSADRQPRTAIANSAQTGEQVLKIVFPGFVDASGNLHGARSVHVVARLPDWAAAMAGGDKNIARQMARDIASQVKDTPKDNSDDAHAAAADASEAPPEMTGTADPFLKSSYHLPSHGSYPLTVREAIAGANMPAIEGFDGLPPPASRTPHPVFKTSPENNLPSIEAIEAAKIRGSHKKPGEEEER